MPVTKWAPEVLNATYRAPACPQPTCPMPAALCPLTVSGFTHVKHVSDIYHLFHSFPRIVCI